MKFAIIGGDMRQAKLAELLASDGHKVSAFALDKLRLDKAVEQASTLREAVSGAQCIVLPLPITSREEILNSPLSSGQYSLSEIFEVIDKGQIVCAGRVGENILELAKQNCLKIIDYYDREEFAVSNAVATAEGALQIIMEEIPITICGAKCLVIGFGRIGKILAHRLLNCGADVTVAARKYSDMAWIKAFGYKLENTLLLDGRLTEYAFVVNTVPSLILNETRLKELTNAYLCLDLASKPGGLDFQAASRLNINAVWALSLPGEVAPVSSGIIIRNTVYNILNEQEVSY